MKIAKTKLDGCFTVEIEKNTDSRGFFARSFDSRIFAENKMADRFVQSDISFNKIRGTLRGMHFQKPHAESKLVRCTRGSIHDVVIDLRKESHTFKQHISVMLSEENHKMIYIPEGMAHGFQTLEDDTEVFYEMSDAYMPEHAHGIRWNDSAFDIYWPVSEPIISAKDAMYQDFI